MTSFLFIGFGLIAFVLFGWYLYRRSKDDTSESTEPSPDAANNVDDVLLTGILLSEGFDGDEHHDSSSDPDSGGYDGGDGGGFDGGGFDSGGFE